MLLVPTFRVATCALAILTILAMASAVLVWRLNFFGLVFFVFSMYHPFWRSRLVLKPNWVEQKTFFQKSNSMVASPSLFFFLIFLPALLLLSFFLYFFCSFTLSRSFSLFHSFLFLFTLLPFLAISLFSFAVSLSCSFSLFLTLSLILAISLSCYLDTWLSGSFSHSLMLFLILPLSGYSALSPIL